VLCPCFGFFYNGYPAYPFVALYRRKPVPPCQNIGIVSQCRFYIIGYVVQNSVGYFGIKHG
jgi:hypothetical protein